MKLGIIFAALAAFGQYIPSSGTSISPIAVIASTGAQSLDGSTLTTPAINATGANLILVGVSYFLHPGSNCASAGGFPNISISDSQSNTYTAAIDSYTFVESAVAALFYSASPSVSASMTVTFTGSTACLPALGVMALSRAGALDQLSSGAQSACTPSPLPTVTPTQNNEAWISIVSANSSATQAPTTTTGTTYYSVAQVTGQSYAFGMAYGVQTALAPINVTWNFGGASPGCQALVYSIKHQ
jgi:hypothetical protein